MGDETDEGNAFSGARQEAIDNNEDEFEVDGKKYDVEGSKKKSFMEVRRLVRKILLEEFDKDRMKCNSPRRIKKGETGAGKKSKVVKACHNGKEKIVKFGDPNMPVQSHHKKNKSSFRARHKCDTKSKEKDWDTASYWACKDW
jgi:hypothetical protein